ncbi:IscS subfamily cysteine desulfurase [Longibacter salinarum]|uniref:IscS subfamily cysteine desulfurase n=1 Tax=Longibacter salinarum TaxID=1850348 RepID=A0A2A8CUX4_9BACT|nr:cysteine desulfurase family protein [Longibacter salinarum]PEN12251.1 IscS subfamily cysteine desulfurase [Longibacter salinarum]
MDRPIYLDHNATTPVDDRVLERMMPYFTDQFGNASSGSHSFGWAAEEAVSVAREQVADGLDVQPSTLTFTSGATEAINAAIKGVLSTYRRKGQHIVTVETEHKAVMDTCDAVETKGADITRLPVDESGRVTAEQVEAALRDDTILVAVMWANNETGVIQPIQEITKVVRDHGALFLVDATQAVGKLPVTADPADLLVASAHKMYGPKGAGILYARDRRPRVRWSPMIHGGGQEDGHRGGTLNVPAVVGMGRAFEIAVDEQADDAERMERLRSRLENRILDAIDDAWVNGADASRLPNTTSLTLPGVSAEDLLLAMRGVACSTGSACASHSNRPSHVLKAHGLSDADARSTVRLSLGRHTTQEEIDHAAEVLIETAKRMKGQPALR